jgi:flagellar assembly factor FliW
MLPLPQKFSISIKKKEKEKTICLLAPIFVNQTTKT